MARRRPPKQRRRPPESRSEAARVSVRLCEPGSERCRSIPPERISDAIHDPDSLVWVDVCDPGAPELAMLREEFGFLPLALEDAARQQQRPRVAEYRGYYLVVMYAPLPDREEHDETTVTEVDLFLGRGYLVTLHRGEVPPLQEAMRRWEASDPSQRGHLGFLIHTVMDCVIDAYFPVVDRLEDRLDQIELSIYGAGFAGPEALLAVKRSLFNLRKAIYPMREIFNTFLSREQSIFGPETYPYFQDVYDHVLRLLDIIDIQRDMATGTLDAHLAVISNRLNQTMQRLTVLGICVALMGAVFGAWGMNFERVPLSREPGGFWLLTACAFGLVALALVWTRLRRLW